MASIPGLGAIVRKVMGEPGAPAGDPPAPGADPGVVKAAPPAAYVADPEKLWSEVKNLKDAALRLRAEEERDWLTAWSYYRGKHWVTWKSDGRLVDIEKQDVPKIVLNFVMHVVQTRLGHLVKNKPIPVGLPANADEESRNATRVGEKALQAYWRKLKMHRKLSEAILWMLVPGNSFWKAYWDPGAGEETPLPPKILPDGTKEERPPVKRGDLAVEMVRPHELLLEPGASNIDECQRVIHRQFRPVAELKRRFKDSPNAGKIKALDPESDQGAATLRQLYGFEGTVPPEIHNRCEVLEVWQRPSEEYPQGLYAVFTGEGQFLAGEPIEDGLPHIPFVHFGELKTDTFYATSTARQLIDLNKVLDIEFSQQEHVRKVHRPKILMPYQANIADTAWDRTDDEVVRYFHPYKPEAFSPPGLPAHHIELRNALVSLLKELGGNFDILSGKAQSDVRSGRMVAYLQEYAGTILGVVAQAIEAALEDAWNMMLRILQAKVTEDRIETVVGRNRRTEILNFKGADLRGVSAIIVQPGSALPMSRAEKYDRIENWMEKGWLDPSRGLRMLDLVDPDAELWEEDELDRENADEIVFMLKTLNIQKVAEARAKAQSKLGAGAVAMGGAQSPAFAQQLEQETLKALGLEAFDFDNHGIFVEHINRGLRKTRLYRRDWTGPNAILRTIADAYVDWHITLAGAPPTDPVTQSGKEGSLDAATERMRAQIGAVGGEPGGAPVPGVGGGAAAKAAAESGAESAQGLPPVPRPPPPGGREHGA